MKITHAISLLIALGFAMPLSAQKTYFQQDFSAGGAPGDYVSATPTDGQFNGVGGGSNLLFNIVGNVLEFDRQIDNTTRGYAVRTTDLSPAPSSLYIQFRFQVLSTSKPGANAVKFYVGSGFSNSPTPPTNAQVYARFAFDIQNSTDFQMNPLPNGGGVANSTQTFSGWQTVTFILNKAGSLLKYVTPAGGLEQQPVDTYDLWVGTTKVFDNQVAMTPSQAITDFKLGFDDGVSKIQVDNFFVRDISSALPVTLLSFTAKPEGDRVQLAWATTSERDADRFVVERSADLGEYVAVGEVAAKGTTDTRQYYGLTDSQPIPGNNYYRLKQIDRDGTSHTFKPASAVIDAGDVVTTVYPNPADPERIHLRLWNASEATVRLLTRTGQSIDSRLERRLGEADLIPEHSLATGIYFMEVQTNGQRRVSKVMIK